MDPPGPAQNSGPINTAEEVGEDANSRTSQGQRGTSRDAGRLRSRRRKTAASPATARGLVPPAGGTGCCAAIPRSGPQPRLRRHCAPAGGTARRFDPRPCTRHHRALRHHRRARLLGLTAARPAAPPELAGFPLRPSRNGRSGWEPVPDVKLVFCTEKIPCCLTTESSWKKGVASEPYSSCGVKICTEFMLRLLKMKRVELVDAWRLDQEVQGCSTVYLDKPMRIHTLMQTIARVNRSIASKEPQLPRRTFAFHTPKCHFFCTRNRCNANTSTRTIST